MKFLFWNTHKNENINEILSELIVENDISVVVLAEYTAEINSLKELLYINDAEMNQYVTAGCERIKILGNIKNVEPGLQTDHYSIQIINNEIIICGIHLNSQIFSQNKEYREILIERLINDIESTEKEFDLKDTVIVGDFNLNPYDDSCIDARFFHSIPIYEEAKRTKRVVSGREFSMFYNPMWNFLGDERKPYGTYYYAGSGVRNTYWNIYDQVIIRPSLKRKFPNESLKIITETKTKYLLDANGHPDKNISDHLPIIFEILEDNYEY